MHYQCYHWNHWVLKEKHPLSTYILWFWKNSFWRNIQNHSMYVRFLEKSSNYPSFTFLKFHRLFLRFCFPNITLYTSIKDVFLKKSRISRIIIDNTCIINDYHWNPWFLQKNIHYRRTYCDFGKQNRRNRGRNIKEVKLDNWMIFQEKLRTYCDFVCFSKMRFPKIAVCMSIKDVFLQNPLISMIIIDNACIINDYPWNPWFLQKNILYWRI